MTNDGAYTDGACSGDAQPIVHSNEVYSPTGAITECGMPLAQWQAKVRELWARRGVWGVWEGALECERFLL